MKKSLLITTFGLFCASVLCAAEGEAKPDAKAEVKAAAKKLSEKANYSWTSTPKTEGGGAGGNFRGGPTEGQTEKGGLTYVKTSFGERTIEAAMKGEKVVIKGEEGWESAADLEGNRQFMARRYQNYKAPAAEAGDLADKATALKKSDGAYTGDMTEEGAKAMMSFGGRRGGAAGGGNAGPNNTGAKGSVKFWLKEGDLTKYEFNVQGKMTGRNDQEITINRTTTVELKEVGTTKLTLPEDAKKKL